MTSAVGTTYVMTRLADVVRYPNGLTNKIMSATQHTAKNRLFDQFE